MRRVKLDIQALRHLGKIFEDLPFEPTEFHGRVWVILDRAFGGVHNSPLRCRTRCKDGELEIHRGDVWVRCPDMRSLATFDFNTMTKLVVLAHHFAIRIEVCLRGRSLWLSFFERERGHSLRGSSMFARHPNLEDAAWGILRGIEHLYVDGTPLEDDPVDPVDQVDASEMQRRDASATVKGEVVS